jgi:hypothetical protein
MWAEFDSTYDTDLVGLYAGPLLESGTDRGAAQ